MPSDALLIGGGLIAAGALAWFKTAHDAVGMSCVMMMPAMHGPWWQGAPLYIGAWGVMMAAMMLPATTPVVLLIARASRAQPLASAWAAPLFLAGYGLVWVLLGVPAYFATLGAQALSATHPALAAAAPRIGAFTVFLAGVYQFTPLKRACLQHCRSPLHLVMHGWRQGLLGPLRMGIEHGLVCAGCCFGLMLVLFVLGIMSLAWMAIIALLMSAEKILPRGREVSAVAGLLMLAFGLCALIAR